jgi:hypothetical protein
MINNPVKQPWYKQFWPWFIITFPAIAVVAGIVTMILAVKSDDGLVNDDYYKEGLAINKTLKRSENAAELELRATADWDKLTQLVTLKLAGKIKPLPERLTLTASHPTRANFDQRIQLYLSPDKLFYSGRSQNIKNGDWILFLEPENMQWRISGRVKLPAQTNWSMQ